MLRKFERLYYYTHTTYSLTYRSEWNNFEYYNSNFKWNLWVITFKLV